jgi:hypothetical protein
MPKQILKEEIDSFLNVVARFPSGASLSEIISALPFSMNRRSVQHRLAFLVKNGLLIAEGTGRGRKYRASQKEVGVKEEPKETIIPLSRSAILLQKKVCAPIQKRLYTNYQRQFLEAYQPNITKYLSDSVSTHLLELGKTDDERPAGTYARKIFHRLLIDLSWNSSRLEGNTYSLLETERLLELSETVEGKDRKEAQMIINHKDAIEFLIESVEEIGINRYTIFNLHALLSNELLDNPENCGRLRDIPVGIAEPVYYPTGIPQVIEECFRSILEKAQATHNPFEQAFFLMVHLPYLQPFEDVNKRVSRLAANIPLIQANLCPLSFIDVPQQTYINGLLGIYEFNQIDLLRDVFVWAYERSCAQYSATRKMLGEPDPFRLKYKNTMVEVVCSIVRRSLDKKKAIAAIRQHAKSLPPQDQAKFIETCERELRGLHEGNIARFRLKLSEFTAWHANWR